MQEEHQGIPEPFGLIIPGQAVRTDFQPTDASASKFTMTLHFPSPSSSSTTTNTIGNDGGIKSPTEIADLVFFLLPNITLPPNTGATLYWSATSHNNPTVSSTTTTTTTTTHYNHHHHYPNGMNNTPFSNYHTNNNTSEFELLGALTPDKTSAVFRTGWGSHERLLYLISNSNNITSTNITSTNITTNNNNNNNNTFMNNNNSSSTFLNNGIGSTQQQPTGISITLGISIEPLDAISNLSLNNSGVSNRTNVAKKIAMDLFNYLQSFDDTNSTSTSTSSTTRTGNNNVKSGWMMVPINVFERWFTRFENKVSRDPNFFMKHEI